MEKLSIGIEVSDYINKTTWGYLGGVSSGVTKLVVGHPFDTVKVRLQTEGYNGRFNSPMQCLLTTIRKEGLFAVYKGATPPLFGWALIDSCQVGTYNMLKIQIAKYSGKSVNDLGYRDIAIAGWGGGVVSTIVATPVEQIKAKLQVQYDATTKLYNGPIDCAKQLIKSRGILALWSGFESTILFRSFFGVFWPTYFLTTKTLQTTSVDASWHPFLAGGVAATSFWVCSFPFDVVKNRIMAQPETKPLKYPSVISCFKYIYRTEGIKGFYRGFTPCLLRSFPTNGAALMVYEGFMSLHKSH